MFSIEERADMIQQLYSSVDNIKVVSASLVSVDIATFYDCKAIVRGLRSFSDYD